MKSKELWLLTIFTSLMGCGSEDFTNINTSKESPKNSRLSGIYECMLNSYGKKQEQYILIYSGVISYQDCAGEHGSRFEYKEFMEAYANTVTSQSFKL